jgi:hypothetical protein
MATMVPGTTVAPPVLAVQIVVVLVMLVLHGLVPLAVVATTGVTTIQVAVQSLMLAFDGAMIAAMRARQSSMQLRMSVAKPVVAVFRQVWSPVGKPHDHVVGDSNGPADAYTLRGRGLGTERADDQ